MDLPLEALECYAAPFRHDEEVAEHMKALAAALRHLGVHDLGSFLTRGAGGWGERFGSNAAVLRERVEGRMISAWPRFEPAPRLEEDQDLRDVETQSAGPGDEALRFHLKRLCDRMAARLRGRALRAAGLRLTLRFERVRGLIDVAPWGLDLPLALPVAEPSQLRRLLQERLETEARRRPLPRPLESLGLAVTAPAPGFSPQRDAFDCREEEAEAFSGLLDRLAQRLGPRRVFHARLVPRHLPEKAWRPDLEAGPAAPDDGPPVDRPSRLLRRPLLLARVEDWLLYWGGGGKARRWRALDWQGPERIGNEWWLKPEEPAGRDYWRVRTAEDVDLWLFCRQGEEARGGALWLQGWWG